MQDFSTSGVRTQAQLANAKNDDGSRKRRKELDSSAGPPDNLRCLKSTNLGKVGSSRTPPRSNEASDCELDPRIRLHYEYFQSILENLSRGDRLADRRTLRTGLIARVTQAGKRRLEECLGIHSISQWNSLSRSRWVPAAARGAPCPGRAGGLAVGAGRGS